MASYDLLVDAEYTLAELGELLGMQPRTIRSYIEQGLLRGPEIGGRGAKYTQYHVDRLRAIRVLKDIRGLALAEVRRRLLTMTAAEIAAVGAEVPASEEAKPGSALAYLRGLRQGEPEAPPPSPVVFAASVVRKPSLSPIDALLTTLDRIAGVRKPSRKARSEKWTSVEVTPDAEIRVRGELSADDRNRWERVADHLRELLLHPSPQSTKED